MGGPARSVAVEPIRTRRLELVSMTAAFMQALARRDVAAASQELNAIVPDRMASDLEHFLAHRLQQLDRDPSVREWLGRAMVLTDDHADRHVIGSLGFHGPPDAVGRAEIGYRVEPEYRRQGFAREAIEALFDWAYHTHGVTRFLASISPDNQPSLRLAREFGFQRIGEQIDDIDGLEFVFETTWPPKHPMRV